MSETIEELRFFTQEKLSQSKNIVLLENKEHHFDEQKWVVEKGEEFVIFYYRFMGKKTVILPLIGNQKILVNEMSVSNYKDLLGFLERQKLI
jgi:hypothetical protein